jgi:hypothetical protein
MSTWSEYFWGTKANPVNPPDNLGDLPPPVVNAKPDVEESLPQYNTFNGLAPEFQVTVEHDPDYIFPREYELIEEVRKQVPGVAKWPPRYILVFLFARRHSVSHSIKLLNKHLQYLESMGFPEISEENLYPFTPDQLSPEELKLALYEGPLLYKHILLDKHERILQVVRPRCWVYGRLSMKKYVAFVLWWYYYTWQHVPLKYHRNGMSVVIDMANMGWSNLDYSVDVQKFITNAITCFPGRMRQAWIVNSGWILSTALTLLSYILSAKIMARMIPVSTESLIEKVEKQYLPTELGGDWIPDVKKDWYDKVFELDTAKRNK